ncbi:MAG: 2OG-Fe(II) oxygenase [Synechococcus sp. TMED20]|jgi:hypothetical protein|nr:MAG: 2OG-Fe(II) oxygenase [Synechococcus sp. TMED20]|tara:strand:- start:873 stop:1466 length:594 start_codon:yes stop_codon:yes gene_type:complete
MLHIVDQLVPDQDLTALRELCNAHGELRQQFDGNSLFSWIATSENSPPTRSPHSSENQALIESYLNQHLNPLIQRFAPDAIGVEWWCNTNNDLDWHVDKDEAYAAACGRHQLPILSTVFYPHSRCAGGELLIADSHDIQPNSPIGIPDFRSVISVPPIVNRLVIFSAGVLHRINPFEGERYSIAVNVWGQALSQDSP